MKVVKYRVFSSNGEFTEWQKGERGILSIVPITCGAGVNMNTELTGELKVDTCVFVTYLEDADE